MDISFVADVMELSTNILAAVLGFYFIIKWVLKDTEPSNIKIILMLLFMV